MKKKLKYLFIGIGILLALLLIYQLAIMFTPDIRTYLNAEGNAGKEELMKRVRSHGVSTGIVLILLMGVLSAIPGFPISAVGVLAGVCYGPLVGTFMNIAGSSLGNLLTFYLIRTFKFIDKSKASNHWVQTLSEAKHPNSSIAVAYMIPVIPSFLVNYTANLLNIKFVPFIWLVLAGAVPSSILYAFGGEALFHGNGKVAILLIASVGILIALILLIKKDRGIKKVKNE